MSEAAFLLAVYALASMAVLALALVPRWEFPTMNLFDYVPARRTDPSTSHAAGKAMKQRVSEIRQTVLLYALDRPDGFTDWEMCHHFGNHSATYRTRRSELTQTGEIVPTQQRRATPSGRSAVVWVHKSYRKEAA